MSDHTGNNAEPTVPLVPLGGYAQPEVPPLEPTTVDIFGSAAGANDGATGLDFWSRDSYPNASADTSYSQPAVPPSAGPSAASTPRSYLQPTAGSQPAATYAQPSSSTAQPSAPLAAEPSGYVAESSYQPTPYRPAAVSTPLHNPVAYDYGYASNTAAPDHPNAVPALVLGLVGLVFFPPLGVVAWVLAAKGRREVEANPGRWARGGTLTAGWVLGIIGSIFTMLGVAALVLLFGFMFTVMAFSS